MLPKELPWVRVVQRANPILGLCLNSGIPQELLYPLN